MTMTAGRRAARRIFAGACGIALVGALTGCSGAAKPELVPSDDGAEPVVTVHVFDNRYEPAEVEVEVGDAVEWVFEGPAKHDVVSDDRSFVSELVPEGTYIHVFDEAGDYAYLCSVHPEMTGVVHVK